MKEAAVAFFVVCVVFSGAPRAGLALGVIVALLIWLGRKS